MCMYAKSFESRHEKRMRTIDELQVFAIFVFGTISSNGWHYDNDQGKEVCIFNESSSACHFGTFVGVIAFVASIALLVGEW